MHGQIIGYRRNGCPVRLIRGGSESAVETPPAGQGGQGEQRPYTPPATQAEFDRIINDRLIRDRSRFADYGDLKKKAERLDAIEEQSKTDLQKAQDAQATAEQRAQQAEVKATRADVAIAKGVPAHLLSGTTQAEMEASADALIAFRGQAAQTPTPGSVPGLNPGAEPPKRAGKAAGQAEAARRFGAKEQ